MAIASLGRTQTGNVYVDSTEGNELVEGVRPDVQMFLPPITGGYKQLTYIITFKWNQSIAGFDLTDLDPKNCKVENLQGVRDTWTANVTLPADTKSIASITVSDVSVTGVGGISGPEVERTLSFAYDTRVPTFSALGFSGVLCQVIRDFSDNTFPYANLIGTRGGGSFEAVMECAGVERSNVNYLYQVWQIGKYTNETDTPPGRDAEPVSTAYAISGEEQAGAVLVKTNLMTCTTKILKVYDNITTAARSLAVVNDTLYFLEGSHYAYYNEGVVRQIANPNDIQIVRLGGDDMFVGDDRDTNFTRVNAQTSEHEWRLDSDSVLSLILDTDLAEFDNQDQAIASGNVLIIDRAKVRITGVRRFDIAASVGVLGPKRRYFIDYVKLDDTDFPKVGDSSPINVLLNISIEDVYSHARLRGLQDDWKGNVGRLYSVSADDKITDLGIWTSADIDDDPHIRDARPYYVDEQDEYIDPYYGVHGGTASPIVWDGENINLITGYGHLDNVTDNNDETARIANWNWISYGDTINTKLPILETNGKNVLQTLEEISILTASVIGFRFDEFFNIPRSPIQSLLARGILTASNSLRIKDINRDAFPADGMVLIDDELISYTSLSGTGMTLNGLSRGVRGTSADSHTADANVYYVNHFIELDHDTVEQPINTIQVDDRLSQVFNQFYINYAGGKEFFDDDSDSIALYGERPLRRSVALDETQSDWIQWIVDQYKLLFKDLHTIVRLQMKISLFLELGDVVYLRCSERDKIDGAYQVISIGHDILQQQTNVEFRSV